MWVDYPDIKPTESGYYFTKYFNPEQRGIYYKAIWYNAKMDKWVAWRPGVDGIEIYRFIPSSVNPYYVPCEMWAEERVNSGDLILA